MIFATANPAAAPDDIIAWADSSGIKVDGHSFDSSRFPHLIEPIRAMADPETQTGTVVGPVQSGKSTIGEIVMAYWACFYNGLIQFNWQDDIAAKWRWETRILPVLNSVAALRWAGGRYDETVCLAKFINTTVLVQGVVAEGSLDSDTVPLQINEEIHLWDAGTLSKARRRQSLVWNKKSIDVSNASLDGDQLHRAYEEGTMEVLESLCPGCGKFHQMRFRWNDKRPDLGGLRFDTSAGRQDGGKFNLNKIEPTIRYQMPCGYIVANRTGDRKRLAAKYRATNDGALTYKRSWSYDAVAVSEISWMELAAEWLSACKAKKSGDEAPLRKFIQERECQFFKQDLIPFSGQIVFNTAITKNRAGMVNRAVRMWAADKQKGYKSKGELSHYWLVIRDIAENGDSQLVFEGKIDTDAELLAVLTDHECSLFAGGIDGSWDTASVKEFCYRNGCNVFMANTSHKVSFLHSDKTRHFHSEGELLHLEMKMPPRFEYQATMAGWQPAREEPMIIQYNVGGLLANLFFVKDHQQVCEKNGLKDFIKWEVPSDVSEDYQKQLDSWEPVAVNASNKNTVEGFRPKHSNDHMTMCEGYIAMMEKMGGYISERLTQMGIKL